jgi:hypothetical protein
MEKLSLELTDKDKRILAVALLGARNQATLFAFRDDIDSLAKKLGVSDDIQAAIDFQKDLLMSFGLQP